MIKIEKEDKAEKDKENHQHQVPRQLQMKATIVKATTEDNTKPARTG